MKNKLKAVYGYLQIRFSVYSDVFFCAFGVIFGLAGLICALLGIAPLAIMFLAYAAIEGCLMYFYGAVEKRKFRDFGTHKVDVKTGEVHFKVLDLTGIGKEAIERDALSSYTAILEQMVRNDRLPVFIVTHRTFVRQFFNALRNTGMAVVSPAALEFTVDSMIKGDDREPLDLTTDTKYQVNLEYVGLRQNRLMALKWHLPKGEALKRYMTPVPYFMLNIKANRMCT